MVLRTRVRVPGKMAEITSIAGYAFLEDLMDTPAPVRAQLYKVLADERPSKSRAMRKISDSRTPPTDPNQDGGQRS